tara:strand:- start:2031 stop:3305 length:1275 start_codon:yes stop_codon:yes gene_type:complete
LIVADIRREIEAARRNADGTRKDAKGDVTARQLKDAKWWAENRMPHPTQPGRWTISGELEPAWEHNIDQLLGDPVGSDEGGGPLYDPTREAAALELIGLTTGTMVPVRSELERYLTQEGLKASYASRTKKALGLLAKWLVDEGYGDNVHAITGRAADQFADFAAPGRTTSTLNSYISALSAYWTWMRRRQIVEGNPWSGQSRRVVDLGTNAEKRPFADDEVQALLTGPANRTLHDMMRLAALSGMRQSEIGNLTVGDVSANGFRVRESKTAAGRRVVPVHPDLADLVARRSHEKEPEAFLIEELTSPPSRPGRRGHKVGEWFTAYRRDLKLDAKREGRRQSDIDFHSFRRWFVTKAEQAGQPESLIRAVVGHKRDGITLGTYSGGPSIEQRRAVVEAVRLPMGTPSESPEGTLGPYRSPKSAVT